MKLNEYRRQGIAELLTAAGWDTKTIHARGNTFLAKVRPTGTGGPYEYHSFRIAHDQYQGSRLVCVAIAKARG